jgi:hypothetical protein
MQRYHPLRRTLVHCYRSTLGKGLAAAVLTQNIGYGLVRIHVFFAINVTTSRYNIAFVSIHPRHNSIFNSFHFT